MKDMGQYVIDTFTGAAPAGFIEVLKKQREKGLAKYGQTCNSEDDYDWGAEALQELADGLVYLACAMDVAQDEEAIRRFGHATMKICEAVGALYSHQEEFK